MNNMINSENKIAKIVKVNTIDNWIDIELKADKYATKSEIVKIQIPNLNDLVFDILKDILSTELCLNYGYNVDLDIWHQPDWQYRFYVSNENATYLTANYFNFVQTLYTEPVNPKVQLSEGMLVYANSILPEALPLLESLGITIETKN